MRSLTALLSQDTVAAAIVDSLQLAATRIGRLTGPPGSGKTHVALLAGATWRDRGGACVLALGDSHYSSRQLYPFLSGLSEFPRDWRGLAKQGSRSALRVADALVGTGGVATSVFDLLASALRQNTDRVLRTLSSLEQEVILELRRLAREKQLLLIADNAHCWDRDSLSLLREVLSDRLRHAIPELQAISLLLVDTHGQDSAAHGDDFDFLCESSGSATWELAYVSEHDFGEVLAALGLSEPLPDHVLAKLYSATGGHLKLAEQLVAYLEQSNRSDLNQLEETEFFTSLLSARIASLGAVGANIAQLLSLASVIGIGFDERELRCLAGQERTDLPELLRRAQSIRFLDLGPGRAQFSHEVLRTFFLQQQEESDIREHRRKFAECLAIIRPSDYETRAAVLLEAREVDRGRELFALALVARLRRGHPSAKVLRDARIEFGGDDGFLAFVEVLARGYAAVASGGFKGALPALKTSSPQESPLMTAERNYVAALCCLELQTAQGIAEGCSILGTWEAELTREPELHLRFLLLLQQAQVLANEFDNARQTEKGLERLLAIRARHDADAAAMLQIQNRRAAAINAPEVAEVRIRQAVAFFRRGTGDRNRDILELYRALTNHAAVLICLGRNADAYSTAQEAERIALEESSTAPRLDVLAGNLVLAGLRSGVFDAQLASEMQRSVIDSRAAGGDDFLHRCNLVAYLLLAGEDTEADQELHALETEIDSHEYVETYLLYYARALRVAFLGLQGYESAGAEHGSMDALVRRLRWPGAPYIRRRHILLTHYFDAIGNTEDRADADRVLLARHPEEIGPAWSYYGRVVPCCELAFWSDS